MPLENDAAEVSDDALWGALETGTELPVAAPDAAALSAADATVAAQQARDEAGRFAGKAPAALEAPIAATAVPANPTAPAVPDAAAQAAAAPDPTAGAPEAVGAPPKGWSPAAKAKWDAMDPDLRAAVVKREEEVSAGFQTYQGLAKHADRCKAAGRTLADEADRYYAAEQNLTNRPIPSLLYLCEAYGVHPQQLLQAMGGAPGGAPQGQPPARAPMPAPQPEFDPRAVVSQVLQERDDTTAVTGFFSDPANRYADNVRPLMSALIQTGQVPALSRGAPLSDVLREAYDMACSADPQVRAAMASITTPGAGAAPNTAAPAGAASKAVQAAAARARTGSVTGAPLPAGTSRDPAATARQADASLWDDTVG